MIRILQIDTVVLGVKQILNALELSNLTGHKRENMGVALRIT